MILTSSPLFLNQENEPPSKEDPSESRKVTWCRNGVLVPRHIYIHLTCPYVLLKAFLLAFPDFQGSWVEVEVCQPGKTLFAIASLTCNSPLRAPTFCSIIAVLLDSSLRPWKVFTIKNYLTSTGHPIVKNS